MTLVLVGYMGSGKSSVGKKLSSILNYDFVDLDHYIEEKHSLTVDEIFNIKGEVFFRKQEHLHLKDLLKLGNTVIALGGGTPCYGNNLELILEEEQVISIYLKASIKPLANRLYHEKSNRPLISHINSDDQMIEFIGKHLFERAPFYEQSDITIKSDGLSIDEIVESILLKLF